MVHDTDIVISADARNQTYLTSGISSYIQENGRGLKNFQEFFSQKLYNIKNIQEFSWIKALLGSCEQGHLEI